MKGGNNSQDTGMRERETGDDARRFAQLRHVRLRYTRSLKRRQTLRSCARFSFATDLSQKGKKPRIELLGSGYETSVVCRRRYGEDPRMYMNGREVLVIAFDTSLILSNHCGD